MIVNTVLKIFIVPIGFLLLIPEMFTTTIFGILVALPPIFLLYSLIMTLIWLPFLGFIMGVSWLYKKVPIIGFPLSLIGIPLVIIIDVFLQLTPNPDKEDKVKKAEICESYPISLSFIRMMRTVPEDIKCPKCGLETVVRTAKKGPNAGSKFYVCSRYPECKGKLPLHT